jgi:hypothetical protein
LHHSQLKCHQKLKAEKLAVEGLLAKVPILAATVAAAAVVTEMMAATVASAAH